MFAVQQRAREALEVADAVASFSYNRHALSKIVTLGEWLQSSDDGEQVELTAGDVFVQNGTRHAWRVEEHCRMAVVLVGTDRQ